MNSDFKAFIIKCSNKTIFEPDINVLSDDIIDNVLDLIQLDYKCYYGENEFSIQKIKYFPGLLATFFYRISRALFLKGDNVNAQEYSSVGFSLSATELYYSAHIGKSFKINHSVSTIVGARVFVGDNVILHHNVTLGDKKGGRPRIGNNVVIYPGTVIVGSIEIEDNVIIGANSFVDKRIKKGIIYKNED